MELEITKEKDIWNKLVEASPHGTIFHLWDWLKIVEKHTNTKLYPLIGYKGSTPVGVYPIFFAKRKFVRFAFSPPPKSLLLYLGPIIIGYDKLKQNKKERLLWEFQREVDNFILSDINANYVRVRTTPRMDSRPFMWEGYDLFPLYTYILELSGKYEDVWNRFSRKTKTGIKKTIREGVTVEIGDKNDLEYLRKSLYTRFKEQGLRPSQDYYAGYLDDLYKCFHPEHMKIFIAKYKGDRVSGLVALNYKDWVALWIGIPKTRISGIYPNDLAQWEAIKWACTGGYRYYEIMDSGDDPRLVSYKAKFNPEPVPWFSAVKYSSTLYRIAEKVVKVFRV